MHKFLKFIFGIKLYMFRTENCPKHVEFYSKNKFWEISASSCFYFKNSRLILPAL